MVRVTVSSLNVADSLVTPEPVPLLPLTIDSQTAPGLMAAVQAQDGAVAVMVTSIVPPRAGGFTEVGLTVNAHGTVAACATDTACPATTMVPARDVVPV